MIIIYSTASAWFHYKFQIGTIKSNTNAIYDIVPIVTKSLDNNRDDLKIYNSKMNSHSVTKRNVNDSPQFSKISNLTRNSR